MTSIDVGINQKALAVNGGRGQGWRVVLRTLSYVSSRVFLPPSLLPLHLKVYRGDKSGTFHAAAISQSDLRAVTEHPPISIGKNHRPSSTEENTPVKNSKKIKSRFCCRVNCTSDSPRARVQREKIRRRKKTEKLPRDTTLATTTSTIPTTIESL